MEWTAHEGTKTVEIWMSSAEKRNPALHVCMACMQRTSEKVSGEGALYQNTCNFLSCNKSVARSCRKSKRPRPCKQAVS